MRFSCLFLLSFSFTFADIPDGYYDAATGLTGISLKSALHEIVDDHNEQSYSSVHSHFEITDIKPNNTVWDMYSDVPNGNPDYVYHFIASDHCGNYFGEGDCYNREHSWPQSWFNNAFPMKSDLFHVYPTDGYVNSHRGSLPYGDVGSASWTSTNGSKKGTCSNPGYNEIVFEPIDEYKGDFARTYFYMSTRYYTEDATWDDTDMTNGADLKDWAVDVLLNWHLLDPVNDKEINRNDDIYLIQENRNPFIDHPEWAECIWDNACISYGCTDADAVNYNPDAMEDDGSCEYEMSIGSPVSDIPTKYILHYAYPNPFNPTTTIRFSLPYISKINLNVYDIEGKIITTFINGVKEAGNYSVKWNGEGLPSSVYFVKLNAGGFTQTQKLMLVK